MFLFYSAEQPLRIKEHVLTQSYPQGHVSGQFGKHKFTYSYLFFPYTKVTYQKILHVTVQCNYLLF
jgi:hypothetical protein